MLSKRGRIYEPCFILQLQKQLYKHRCVICLYSSLSVHNFSESVNETSNRLAPGSCTVDVGPNPFCGDLQLLQLVFNNRISYLQSNYVCPSVHLLCNSCSIQACFKYPLQVPQRLIFAFLRASISPIRPLNYYQPMITPACLKVSTPLYWQKHIPN